MVSISNLIYKIVSMPYTFRMRVYPYINQMMFRLNHVEMGDNNNIYNQVYIRNDGSFIIGNNFLYTSGDGLNPISSEQKGCIYIEKGASVSIGNDVMMSSTRIWVANGLTIGNYVRIGACCLIMDTDTHQLDYRIRKFKPQTVAEIEWRKKAIKTAPIIIEDDVWIGAHCIVLKGVTIGARSIIGAGSVVTKDIPADCIAAGNPCRVIRSL